jgi:signal transduction histidine kinase/CheY-like chemotaxis protein
MIDAESLARHFPVHAIIGPGMELLQIGSALRRLAGAAFPATTCFGALFDLERPGIEELDLGALRALGPRLCLLRFKPNGMRIRAEFVPAAGGGVVMLGSAGIASTGELADRGLTLNDFTAHDPTTDFLMAVTTHRATLDDLRRLTAVLEHQKEELKRSNELLAVATAEARRASEVKSRFLSQMSHELRTPLHAISGFSKLLLEKREPGNHDEFLDAIHGSAELLVSLVGQGLDLAKIEAGRQEITSLAFDPRALFGRIMRPQQQLARVKGLSCEWRVDLPGEAWLEGDALRIGQIVMNLVGNSVKFTEHGWIEVAATWRDGFLRVEVKDSGPGIAVSELDEIFQPFVRVGRTTVQAEGTGLGLAISRELAELMGGTLTAASDGRSGSLFRLELPVPLSAPPPQEAVVIPAAPTPRAVLVVDDNDLNRLLGQRLLERDGHSVQVARDGEEALAMIARRMPDVVLMDLQMPGLDGLQTMREIRRRGLAVPVIALTANAVNGDRERCLAAGMSGYLTKPLDLPDLRAALCGLEAVPA